MIKVGRGWRLGYPGTPPYVALIGSDVWAFELTTVELQDLTGLLGQVLTTIEDLHTELADQENFSITIDSELWQLEAEGMPDHWQLRLQTRSGRRAEGFLSSSAVVELEKYLREQILPDSVPGV